MANILVCDDERDIVNALRIYLEAAGYTVVEAFNGKQAIEAAAKGGIGLILMDIMMPVMDGITAMTKIREQNNIPIILLTAKSESTDKVLGLDVGADDYVTKPFNPVELMARVRSQIRRYTRLGSRPQPSENASQITIGGITLDDLSKAVTVEGEAVSLTPTEYEILKLLMFNAGVVMSPQKIYESVHNENGFGSENAVAVHIRHLREKIEINPAEPKYIKVVWAHGYKFEKE